MLHTTINKISGVQIPAPEGQKCFVLFSFHLQILHTKVGTGGPPLTRKSLTRFPLTRFLAYVRVSGELALVGDHSTVPLT